MVHRLGLKTRRGIPIKGAVIHFSPTLIKRHPYVPGTRRVNMRKDRTYWLSRIAIILSVGLIMEAAVMFINNRVFISGIGATVVLLLFVVWGLELLGKSRIEHL